MNHSSIILEDQHKYQSNNNEEEDRMLTAKLCDVKKTLISRRNQQEFRPESTLDDINQLFDERQLLILNDMANNNAGDINSKEEFRSGLTKQMGTGPNKLGLKRHSVYVQKQQKQNDKPPFVFNPEDKSRILWDLFTMVIIFIAILILPLDISFTINSQFFDIFNYISIIIFTLDILLNFNTAFQKKGETIKDRRAIAMNYFKAWFWIDLISTFPFDIIIDLATRDVVQESADESTEMSAADAATSQSNRDQLISTMRLLRILKFFRFIKVVRLLRVLKLKKIFSKFEDYVDLSNTMESLFQVLKLTFIMLFVAHWLACIWHFIADQELSSDSNSWLRDQGLEKEDWYVKYIASVYWATATMTTVGYGDIVPVTSVEKIFGIVVMLLACCIFAYIMNSIGGIFVTMDQNEKQIRQKMGQANQFLNSNDIPKELQARVRKYLEYKYEKESTQVDEKEALKVLSSSLRDEVLAAVNTDLIEKSKIFLNTRFDREILCQLPFLLEEQIFGPEECIFLEGEDQIEKENGSNLDERFLYFLNQGQVMLCIQKTFTYLKTLEKGETFGELGFFSTKPRSASAYTLDFVYVQKLKKLDYIKLLKSRKTQNEYFQMNKHILEISNDYSPLGLECYGCQAKDHFAHNCPNLHFIINHERRLELIGELHYQEKKEQKEFKRHERVRYHSLACFTLTNQVAGEIKQVYQGYEDDEDEKLYKLQQHNENEPTEEGFQQIEGKNEILNRPDDEFDRIYPMQEFFNNYNADIIIMQYNQLAQERVRSMDPQERRQKRQFTNKKNMRSSSAERASYFEKLIQKYGGPTQFLEKLNQIE